MTDSANLQLDGETPVNPYSLLEAVNRSSDAAHMAWLVFLGIMTYLTIAVAGVTHRDLLLETPVSLPILQVDIQLTQFFQFAPIVLVLFHLGLVSQLALLARKTIEFDSSIQLLEMSTRRTHPLRLELHNFFFVQAMGGPHRSMVMGAILHTMSWLTLVILPVVLILYIQVSFLPYHGGWITWTHRLALLFDIAILVLIGVFLARAETSFFQAFMRAGKTNPATFLVTMILLSVVTFFSFFIATIPGEALDRIARSAINDKQPDPENDAKSYYSGFVLSYLTNGADGALFGIFKRNLVVTDTDLVVDRDVSTDEPTLSLRGRDLRYAKLDRSDMHQADFTGANLGWASLKRTDLRDAWLNCADVSELFLSGDRDIAQCVSARGADFSGAKLVGANLSGIDAQYANFGKANLDGAELDSAILIGAEFPNARLRYANLGSIQAKGSNFGGADLLGADFNGAKMYGAALESAQLVGAKLDYAHLQGAKLNYSFLQGATLYRAHLRGADFTSAKISGADFRGAIVWLTYPPQADDRHLADFEGLRIIQPKKSELDTLENALKATDGTEDQLAKQLLENDNLSALLKNNGDSWLGSDPGRLWQSLSDTDNISIPTPTPVSTNGDTGDNISDADADDTTDFNGISTPAPSTNSSSTYSVRLTSYLAKLMCRVRWADGSVARGIVRRAMTKKFKGNLVDIEQRLQSSSCPASKAIPAAIMTDLSAATDQMADN